METKFRIALSMGHDPVNSGASRGNIDEYGISCAIIGELAFELKKLGHEPWIIGADSNKKQVEDINILNADFGLELHMNNMASKPEWNGSLCMHSGNLKSELFAKNVNDNVSVILNTKNKGVYKGHYQLDKRKELITMIKYTNCPFIVIEPLYLSNDDDFKKINITLITIGILRGCINYWEGLK